VAVARPPLDASWKRVRARVRSVWLRAVARSALRTAGRGLLAGAAAWWAAWGVGWIVPVDEAPFALAVTAVVGIVLALDAWRVARRPETMVGAALRIDAVAQLDERTVAACEHGPHAPARSVFSEALLRDAADRVERLEPGDVVRLAPPVRALAASALLVVAAIVGRPPAASSSASGEVPSGPPPSAATELADRVEEAAVGREDPYLDAVRDALRQLASEVEAGDVAEPEARRRLTELSEHVRRAFDQAGLPDPTAPRTASPGEAPAQGDTGQPQELDTLAPPPLSPPDDMGAGATAEDGTGEADEGAEAGADGARIRRDTPESSEMTAVDYGDLAREQAQRFETAEQRTSDAAGETIGAAQESTRGASERAGAGRQPLEGEAQEQASPERVEAVALPEADTGEGRRIDIELTPEEETGELIDDPGRIGDWRATAETPIRDDPIPARHAEAMLRYFTPPDEGHDQEAP
jgi:hypothetical protein